MLDPECGACDGTRASVGPTDPVHAIRVTRVPRTCRGAHNRAARAAARRWRRGLVQRAEAQKGHEQDRLGSDPPCAPRADKPLKYIPCLFTVRAHRVLHREISIVGATNSVRAHA